MTAHKVSKPPKAILILAYIEILLPLFHIADWFSCCAYSLCGFTLCGGYRSLIRKKLIIVKIIYTIT